MSEDVLQEYLEAKKFYSFEGESGVKKLETLCEDLGYEGSGFAYGDPIHSFLCDNPGACDAIIEFIGEWIETLPEWKESLKDHLSEEGEDEDDDEDLENDELREDGWDDEEEEEE